MFLRLSKAQLKEIMPRIPDRYATAFIDTQGELDGWGITANVNRYGMWIANVAHECGEFHEMVENGNYRTETILRTWPSRFKSVAQAAPYAHNGPKLFNMTYANRMGNGPPSSGDGFKFRGRGEPQVTGKDGYKNVGHVANLPLTDDPDLAMALAHMNRVGAAFWEWKSLNRFADAGDFYTVVGRWNGGHIGMVQRKVYLNRALAVLKKAQRIAEVTPPRIAEVPSEPLAESIVPPTIPPIDPRGEPSEVVPRAPTPAFDAEAAQRKLRALGYWPGNVDGDEGSFMRDALLSFQADNHLPITGTLDDATWAELTVAGPKFVPESRANATVTTLREKGSETISLTDRVKRYAAWLVGGGTVGTAAGGDQAGNGGWLDSIQGYYYQFSMFVEPAKAVIAFIREHQFLLFVGLGLLIWFVAHKIQQRRVEDERTGANRGR